MAVKKNYISDDLDFVESQLSKWKQYMVDNPYDLVEDRKEAQVNKKTGGIYYAVVQSKEAIQKNLRDTNKEYLAMLQVVKGLREIEEEKKKIVRGGEDVPESMSND